MLSQVTLILPTMKRLLIADRSATHVKFATQLSMCVQSVGALLRLKSNYRNPRVQWNYGKIFWVKVLALTGERFSVHSSPNLSSLMIHVPQDYGC